MRHELLDQQLVLSDELDQHRTSGIGWILGHLIDGTQAELVGIPFDDNSLYRLPDGVADDAALLLSDILPTGFEIGVQYGRVKPATRWPSSERARWAWPSSPPPGSTAPAQIIAIDLDENKLDVAKQMGATHRVSSGAGAGRSRCSR